MTNFNLSEKINVCADDCYPEHVLYVKDVKEFIRLLKIEAEWLTGKNRIFMIKQINKLAGDKLK